MTLRTANELIEFVRGFAQRGFAQFHFIRSMAELFEKLRAGSGAGSEIASLRRPGSRLPAVRLETQLRYRSVFDPHALSLRQEYQSQLSI